MFGLLKKMIFGKDSTSEQQPQNQENKKDFGKKVDGILDFTSKKIDEAKNNFFEVKEKMSNLLQTNYDLGLKHLEKGNLSDAIFRFKFIKRFWPDSYDAYYLLAYTFVLKKKNQQAEEVLIELLTKNPNYDQKAQQLLEKIRNQKINGNQ